MQTVQPLVSELATVPYQPGIVSCIIMPYVTEILTDLVIHVSQIVRWLTPFGPVRLWGRLQKTPAAIRVYLYIHGAVTGLFEAPLYYGSHSAGSVRRPAKIGGAG